jgi:hypothetical protein
LSIKGVLKTDFFFCKIIEALLLKVESGISEPLLRECSFQQCDRSSAVHRLASAHESRSVRPS